VVGSLRLRSANGGLDGQTRGVGATHHSDPPPPKGPTDLRQPTILANCRQILLQDILITISHHNNARSTGSSAAAILILAESVAIPGFCRGDAPRRRYRNKPVLSGAEGPLRAPARRGVSGAAARFRRKRPPFAALGRTLRPRSGQAYSGHGTHHRKMRIAASAVVNSIKLHVSAAVAQCAALPGRPCRFRGGALP